MCGIFFSIATGKTLLPSNKLLTALERRGPDASRTTDRRVTTREGTELHLNFHSTVLALRGEDVFQQPVTNDTDESVLTWNGEAWERGDVPIETNDTQEVYSALLSVDTKASNLSDTSHADAICRVFTSIAGPFAFVFYHAPTAMLYFARDATGRRSLMYKRNADSFSLSSCSDPDAEDGWQELEPSGMYYIQLSQIGNTVVSGRLSVQMELFPWNEQFAPDPLIPARCTRQVIARLNRTLEPASGYYSFDRANVGQLRSQIHQSLHLRLRGIPTWKQKHSNASMKSGLENHARQNGERVGILFSGGLDCTVLARLAHDVLPPDQAIALLNVTFENPRLAKSGKSREAQYEECPDRKTGRSSLVELQQTCPDRQWLFIAVNITFEEMSSHRDNIVSLIKPHDTEMDLSIAMALYFAARGVGTLGTTSDTYTTSAQVLLSGLGADELFGGYVRHETAYRRGGLAALVDELQLDIARIGTRNLGRDDRVTGYWAKEMRYPFLDEKLVAWVVALPVWQKCRFGFARPEDGFEAVEPAKYLLRLLALDLGLMKTALEKKRAIQFGSRSAKMFDRKTKGTESIKAH